MVSEATFWMWKYVSQTVLNVMFARQNFNVNKEGNNQKSKTIMVILDYPSSTDITLQVNTSDDTAVGMYTIVIMVCS